MTRNKTLLWLETRIYKAKMFSKILLFLLAYNFNVNVSLSTTGRFSLFSYNSKEGKNTLYCWIRFERILGL